MGGLAVPQKTDDFVLKRPAADEIQTGTGENLFPVGKRNRAMLHESWPAVKSEAFAGTRGNSNILIDRSPTLRLNDFSAQWTATGL